MALDGDEQGVELLGGEAQAGVFVQLAQMGHGPPAVAGVFPLVKALGVVKDCEQSGVWGEAAAGWRAALTAGEVVRQRSPTVRSRCIHAAGSGLEAGSLFMPKSVPDVRDEIQFRPCKVRKATEWLRPSRTTPDAESPPLRLRCTDLGL